MKRPMNTVLPPCLAKNFSDRGSRLAKRLEPFEQATPADPAERVADVVADDRARCRDDDHPRDREVVLSGRREDGGGDERRLAGDRDARRLDRDGEEEEDEPV